MPPVAPEPAAELRDGVSAVDAEERVRRDPVAVEVAGAVPQHHGISRQGRRVRRVVDPSPSESPSGCVRDGGCVWGWRNTVLSLVWGVTCKFFGAGGCTEFNVCSRGTVRGRPGVWRGP